MNEIQKKLLEIAVEYIKVCEKLNLKYYASAGTCLGAIRHKGFIPWDDDMDFNMPREDYEIFLKEGQKLFNEKYFIQTHKTDKNYYFPFAKVRDSSTTAIQNETKNIIMNQGLWIDVFPTDELPKSTFAINCTLFLKKWFFQRRILSCIYEWSSWRNKLYNALVKIAVPSKELAYIIDLWLSKRNNKNRNDLIWDNYLHYMHIHIKKKDVESTIIVDFENTKIKVPSNWDNYLTCNYGDWRTLPPIEKQKPVHSFFVLDLKKPYIFYTKKITQ